MLAKQYPQAVKFVCTFIYSEESLYQKVKAIFIRKFGLVDFESDRIDFDFTEYYYPEMGQPLFRRFISFEKLKNPVDLVKIKNFAIKIEKKFAINNRRQINIDPGYLAQSKLVLTTTKDFSHRIYLGKGIYAEVTLQFKDGKFIESESTFPDYRTKKYKDIFFAIRKIYRKQL